MFAGSVGEEKAVSRGYLLLRKARYLRAKARLAGSHRNGPPEAECPLCLNFGAVGTTAECGHTCCDWCWSEWLARNSTCPFCRCPLDIRSFH
mmetsp:Transcript_24056/g.58677  ORF Transcript_24056/g.58677 Transcript_24056/m.58677 type:complete len:92 (+) Transcript_24056:1-276(+)